MEIDFGSEYVFVCGDGVTASQPDRQFSDRNRRTDRQREFEGGRQKKGVCMCVYGGFGNSQPQTDTQSQHDRQFSVRDRQTYRQTGGQTGKKNQSDGKKREKVEKPRSS